MQTAQTEYYEKAGTKTRELLRCYIHKEHMNILACAVDALHNSTAAVVTWKAGDTYLYNMVTATKSDMNALFISMKIEHSNLLATRFTLFIITQALRITTYPMGI